MQGRGGGSQGIPQHRPAAAAETQAEAELGEEEEVRHSGELRDGDGGQRVDSVEEERLIFSLKSGKYGILH